MNKHRNQGRALIAIMKGVIVAQTKDQGSSIAECIRVLQMILDRSELPPHR
jgi:hypothetical protein